MKQHITHIDLDFDEIQYQGKTRTEGTGEVNEFEKNPEKTKKTRTPMPLVMRPRFSKNTNHCNKLTG